MNGIRSNMSDWLPRSDLRAKEQTKPVSHLRGGDIRVSGAVLQKLNVILMHNLRTNGKMRNYNDIIEEMLNATH